MFKYFAFNLDPGRRTHTLTRSSLMCSQDPASCPKCRGDKPAVLLLPPTPLPRWEGGRGGPCMSTRVEMQQFREAVAAAFPPCSTARPPRLQSRAGGLLDL